MKAWMFAKAVVYALLLMLAGLLVVGLLAWTKGLLLLLLVFGVLVKGIYDKLECRHWHSEKARKRRDAAWRNYQ